MWKTYAPVEAEAVPEGAAEPAGPTAGTLTGVPGLGGSLPDGELDPELPDSPSAGELESGGLAEPTAAGVGVAVTVTETVTDEHDGQVGHAADEPASPGAGTAGTAGADTDGTAEPACTGTPTAGTETAGVLTAATGLDGEGVAMTGGPTTALEDAPASTAIGLEVGTTMGTMGTTVGVLWAGQFLTVGAQLVMTSAMVLKAVASAAPASATAGAETCS